MNVSLFLIKDYEGSLAFGGGENKPGPGPLWSVGPLGRLRELLRGAGGLAPERRPRTAERHGSGS